ncbi:MAG TPA: glycosyltransferase [Flavobacteriales bacterium]|nr:glycosyltransferase [Flavobacteriales bacterium]
MKILIILSRVPFPLEKGDKLRAFNQIKQLSRNHEISLFAINDLGATSKHQAVNVLSKYCKRIEIVNLAWFQIMYNIFRSLLSGLPLQVGYFYSSAAARKLQSLIDEVKPDHIYCQLVRTAEYVKHIKDIPKTIDYMDAFSKGVERRIPIASPLFKPILKRELKTLLKYEATVMNWFDNSLIISSQDKEHLSFKDKERISIIPNGVDSTYFHPMILDKKYDILFCGNMAYSPNIETAEYLVKEILPKLLPLHPDIKVAIVGTDPTSQVRALKSKNVEITGWVEDMRTHYASARVFVAPMQTSIGMQNKLLEAMVMKIPCVTSSMANNAIGAVHEESILIGNDPDSYAEQISALLKDETKAASIAESGYNFVNSTYTWEHVTDKLERFFS